MEHCWGSGEGFAPVWGSDNGPQLGNQCLPLQCSPNHQWSPEECSRQFGRRSRDSRAEGGPEDKADWEVWSGQPSLRHICGVPDGHYLGSKIQDVFLPLCNCKVICLLCSFRDGSCRWIRPRCISAVYHRWAAIVPSSWVQFSTCQTGLCLGRPWCGVRHGRQRCGSFIKTIRVCRGWGSSLPTGRINGPKRQASAVVEEARIRVPTPDEAGQSSSMCARNLHSFWKGLLSQWPDCQPATRFSEGQQCRWAGVSKQEHAAPILNAVAGWWQGCPCCYSSEAAAAHGQYRSSSTS